MRLALKAGLLTAERDSGKKSNYRRGIHLALVPDLFLSVFGTLAYPGLFTLVRIDFIPVRRERRGISGIRCMPSARVVERGES